MDNTKIEKEIYSLGLSGSGIGVWWIKKIDDNFTFFQTGSKDEEVVINVNDLPPLLMNSTNWKSTFRELREIKKEYKIKLDSAIRCNDALFDGTIDKCSKRVPWLNDENEIIWLQDQVYVLEKDEQGNAKTMMGVTINESVRQDRRDLYQTIEEVNIKLRIANERAIELANLLVWSMDFDDFPKGDLYFGNEMYSETLGMKRNENGHLDFSDFINTSFPDEEGKESMSVLMKSFEETINGNLDEFFGVIVKHRNLNTGEARYLEHFTRVEEKYPDKSIKKIGGYIIDMTEKVKMEKENEELDRKNKNLMLAQKLALTSGKVMVWFLNSESKYKKDDFYGNDLLFEKLGIRKNAGSTFFIQDFNSTIYDEDEEGRILKEAYFLKDDQIESNKAQSYERVLVKHKSLTSSEIFYFEHNFVVEERYPDGSLKIRGGFMNDVTTETLYKKRIEYLVKHDVVTGLSNRNMFEDFIVNSLPEKYALLVFDIDGLKFINDAYGHLKGDEVISALGKYLAEVFSLDSDCFRIGGDEFAIITNTIDTNTIEQRIQKIKELVVDFSQSSNLAFSISVGYEIVLNPNTRFTKVFTNAENIMYRRKLSDRNSRKSKTMTTVLETLNSKTEETKAHCDRLGKYAVMVLKQMGYTRTSDLEDIWLLCTLHDIGKITISEEILSKPGKLTKEEFYKIKQHSEAGYKIVKNIVDSDRIANAVLYHHERYDGHGYPFNLKEEEIPLFAKILSVCDSYDVMVTGRAYQESKTKKQAMAEIERCSGTQFDPVIAQHFLTAIEKQK